MSCSKLTSQSSFKNKFNPLKNINFITNKIYNYLNYLLNINNNSFEVTNIFNITYNFPLDILLFF